MVIISYIRAFHTKVAVVAPGLASTLIVNCVLLTPEIQNLVAVPKLLLGVTQILDSAGVISSPWFTAIVVVPEATVAVPDFSVTQPILLRTIVLVPCDSIRETVGATPPQVTLFSAMMLSPPPPVLSSRMRLRVSPAPSEVSKELPVIML